MSGPFRELFSELPTALFDLLKGIGEEAVRKAQPPPLHHRPSITSQLSGPINDAWLGDYLCERLGCKRISTFRAADRRELEFAVCMLCGHKRQFAISECALEDPIATMYSDMIESACRGSKRCYCVERQ
jgi:hypothetical protein